ncbi:hypothetical protein [Chloroflexus sp.]|uniref:hypothetical protein n=1 Tax=Chloroflexus sp. TaxID=1904827 RepID=UPI002579B7F9|nr:hypothetical protein [Chloroflexus sp.]
MYDYDALERDLETVFAFLKAMYPDEDLTMAREFIDVGEYGLAYDEMCVVIANRRTILPPGLAHTFRSLGARMGIDPRAWGVEL